MIKDFIVNEDFNGLSGDPFKSIFQSIIWIIYNIGIFLPTSIFSPIFPKPDFLMVYNMCLITSAEISIILEG